MRVRLTRRLAERLNGIDLSRRRVGEIIDLARHDAEMLVAEGWAAPAASDRAVANDAAGRAASRSARRKKAR